MANVAINTRANVLDLLMNISGFDGRFNLIPYGRREQYQLMVMNTTSNDIEKLRNIMAVTQIPCVFRTERGTTSVKFFTSSLHEAVKIPPC